jgi:hypothetical protein
MFLILPTVSVRQTFGRLRVTPIPHGPSWAAPTWAALHGMIITSPPTRQDPRPRLPSRQASFPSPPTPPVVPHLWERRLSPSRRAAVDAPERVVLEWINGRCDVSSCRFVLWGFCIVSARLMASKVTLCPHPSRRLLHLEVHPASISPPGPAAPPSRGPTRSPSCPSPSRPSISRSTLLPRLIPEAQLRRPPRSRRLGATTQAKASLGRY